MAGGYALCIEAQCITAVSLFIFYHNDELRISFFIVFFFSLTSFLHQLSCRSRSTAPGYFNLFSSCSFSFLIFSLLFSFYCHRPHLRLSLFVCCHLALPLIISVIILFILFFAFSKLPHTLALTLLFLLKGFLHWDWLFRVRSLILFFTAVLLIAV